MPVRLTPQGLKDDAMFWLRQIGEHALFISLGMNDDEFKRDGEKLYGEATSLLGTMPALSPEQAAREFLRIAEPIRALKVRALNAQTNGWHGWLYPSFLDHVRRELDFAARRISNGYADLFQEQCDWLTFMAEHAGFAAGLVDPSEKKVIADALTTANKMSGLRQCCVQPCTAAMKRSMVDMSIAAGREMDQFVEKVLPATKSVIHPVLAAHVLREGRRFLGSATALANNPNY